jgi:hypothetical protein
VADATKSPVGMGAGAISAYTREGAVIHDRSLVAGGASLVAGGGEWVDPSWCGATKKDGSLCEASPVNGKAYCIGHLRGAKEGT